MTRSEFLEMRRTNGAYMAALCANIAGVKLANVELWIRGV